MSSSWTSQAVQRCDRTGSACRVQSGAESRGAKAVHYATSERVRSARVCLPSRCQRGQKNAAIFVMWETIATPLKMPADFGHTFRGELVVEIVPELLNCAAAVDIAVTLSHPSIRVGRAERW